MPATSEKVARQQAQTVATTYRPDGRKPELPVLRSDSSLSNVLTYAMLNQPKVESAYDDWLASIERITVARSLPDPQLTFQMDIQSIVTSLMPGFLMNFPGPGKLHAEADVASGESQAKYFAFQSAVLESAFEVKRAYYQLYFLEEKIRVGQETLALVADLEKLARTQNEVGKVTLQDVLRAQIEEDRLRTDIANLEDSRQALLAEFKAALGIRPEAAAPPIPSRFESTPLDLNSTNLWASAVAHNTRLKAVEAEVHAAEAAIVLARKARVPDSSLGLMADLKMNPVLYRPVASVSLPIWRDKIAAQIAEAQANKQGVEARLSAEQIALAVSFAERSFLYRESNRTLELLRQQLLPKATESVEVARTGYLAGQIDFFNLMDSERTLLGFELDAVEAQTARELALAEIALIVEGMPPTDLAMPRVSLNGAGSSPGKGPSSGGVNSMR
jgi:cobalt-zinc-cadmium efflux system outer membrane protein